MIGTTLSHFRIVAKMGEGGMGVVYRAEDVKLHRLVALKVLPPDLVGNAERRLRFLREARAAAAVSHPNIATIYEVGEADGVVFIAMECIEGQTLRERIGGRPMAMKEALRIAVEIAEGLAQAHQAQVIHRDLKPDNVIVAANGHAKILDFGLAKLLEVRGEGGGAEAELDRLRTISDEMTREGRVFGTVAYMSPEQARGEPVDARSDLFSLGITLYEMATGKAPFQGKTSLDTLSAIIQKEVVPPAVANPAVPPELERIINKCLRKDPQERYQHSDEIVVDLRELKRVTDSGVQAVRQPDGGRDARPPVRVAARIVGAVAAVGAVTLAVLLALNAGGLRGRLTAWLSGREDGAAGRSGTSTPARFDSLAVLPLANLSGDPGQEYFADGMTEALITGLAQIREIKVISRTSVMHFKGTSKPLPEIAKELNVAAIVEGSVLRSGERVRITAQLVDGMADRHLWAKSYERDLRDVLTLQAEVAGAIASEIRATLTPQQRARLATARPLSPEAYDAYLKGRYYWNLRTAEGVRRGREYFEKSIALDPGFAPAYSGLADSYHVFGSSADIPPREIFAKARAAAEKAILLDESLAEGHTSLAGLLDDFGYHRTEAEREYQRAVELNPNYATAHHWYALDLAQQGRFDEALAAIERARALDPLSLILNANIGRILYQARRYDAAIEQCRKTLELDPNFGPAHFFLGWAYTQKGALEEALQELRLGASLIGTSNMGLGDIGHVLALAGHRAEATRVLKDLLERSKHTYVSARDIAIIYVGLGNRAEAIRWLDKAYEDGEGMKELMVEPRFDPLRSDPRFQDLMRRIGRLPDEQGLPLPPAGR